MQDQNTTALRELYKLLCRQHLTWESVRNAVRGGMNDPISLVDTFRSEYNHPIPPLTSETLKVLSKTKFMIQAEAHNSTAAIIQEAKDTELIEENTPEATLTIGGLKSLIWFMSDTLHIWERKFEEALEIKDNEELKMFLIMKVPTIQGLQNHLDIRAIAKIPYNETKAREGIALLISGIEPE